MVALERSPFLTLNAVYEPLNLQRLHRSQALSTRSTLSGGARVAVPCVVVATGFTRATRHAKGAKGDKGDKGDKGPGGVQKWFEEKKTEGTAGVGGAVIGGMLGGPLGAVVGSQVASKLGPVLNDALDALEVETDSEEDKDIKDSKQESPSTKKANVEKSEKREEPLSSVELPETGTFTATKEPQVAKTASSATEPLPTQPSQMGLSEELQRLRDNAAEKKRKLETEIDDLYVKAEEALLTGNEESAREFLEARSKAQASLKRMMEGAEKRIQHQQEKVNDLEKEAEELYRKAEISLKAGEDEMARTFLKKRQSILQRVQQLQDLAP